MAIRLWQPRQRKQAQVAEQQITTNDASTTYTLAIGDVSFSTVGLGSKLATVQNLASQANSSDHPYFSAITWSDDGTDKLTSTADTPGEPYTWAITVAGGSGAVGSYTVTTANLSPNDLDDEVNLSGSGALASSDTLVVSGTAESILWGLDQSSLTSVTVYVDRSFSGTIGLDPERFYTGGSLVTTAAEYRDTALHAGFGDVLIGRSEQGASNITPAFTRIMLKNAAASGAFHIESTGPAWRTGQRTVNIEPGGASNTIRQVGGSLGLGTGDQSATWTVGTVKTPPNGARDMELSITEGMTATAVSVESGRLDFRVGANLATLNVAGTATAILDGVTARTITTLSVGGSATVSLRAPFTITNLSQTGGTIDFGQSDESKTVTNYNFQNGELINSDSLTITTLGLSNPRRVTVAAV